MQRPETEAKKGSPLEYEEKTQEEKEVWESFAEAAGSSWKKARSSAANAERNVAEKRLRRPGKLWGIHHTGMYREEINLTEAHRGEINLTETYPEGARHMEMRLEVTSHMEI